MRPLPGLRQSSKPFGAMPQNRTLRLGTRGSKLALVQAEMVRSALAGRGRSCDLVILKTSGDRILDRSLADAGGKGLFIKELEDALLRDDIDLAVHSMKDVPTELPAGLELCAFLKREDPREAFVSHKARTLGELPAGARVGTSSVRRQAQVARRRPDLNLVLLRGNVDTRLRKLDAGEMDAIFLAYAGLKRLGLGERATEILSVSDWLPSLGQGVLGIEIRKTDTSVREMLGFLNDDPSEIALLCERAFQAALDGSCRTPIAGLAQVEDGMLSFRGEVLAPDGSDFAATSFTAALGHTPREAAERAGRDCGLALKPRVAKWLAL
jgi:hydroxymethylbilane synthase